jgi:hypothetical protein
MAKTINLEEIMEEVLIHNNNSFDMLRDSTIVEDVKKIVKEAISQALELAAENADVIHIPFQWCEEIDKETILDTINQIQ